MDVGKLGDSHSSTESTVSEVTVLSEHSLTPNMMKLSDYSNPGVEHLPKDVDMSFIAASDELDPGFINIIEQDQFGGELTEYPNLHLQIFCHHCSVIKVEGYTQDQIRRLLFPFSLKGSAESWLDRTALGITDWETLALAFYRNYFPPQRTAMIRREIICFTQTSDETLSEAWERFKELVRLCPHHRFPKWLIVTQFYEGLNYESKLAVIIASKGSFYGLEVDSAWDTIESMASHDAQYGRPRGLNKDYEKERRVSSRDNGVGDELSVQFGDLGLSNRSAHHSISAVNSTQDVYACGENRRPDARGDKVLPQHYRNAYRWTMCRLDIHEFNDPFIAVYESLIQSAAEKSKQKQLIALLEKLVCKEWPNAKLYLYGSCVNSFGLQNSDIDVCLAIEDRYITQSEMLLRLADILQYSRFHNVQALTRARVPIVKLMDPVTGISCDICINNFSAIINTKLLRNYAEIDVRLRQLALLVKHWAKCRGINDPYQGTLSSYAYVLMCIHFLQQCDPPILPCLQGMRTTYAVTVDYTEYGFFDQVEELRHFGALNTENIAQLMWDFFRYWAYCHDYANTVISIRIGSIISKHEKGWTRSIGNDRHLISIEDPIDTKHDLGRVVNQNSIRVLREEFERAASIMQYGPYPCLSLFEAYVPS